MYAKEKSIEYIQMGMSDKACPSFAVAGESDGKDRKQGLHIILIGMPGVGKSTIGVILAKELGYQFIDSDLLIQQQEGRLLRTIIEEEGVEGFLAIENQVNAGIQARRAVIATGGSAVYGTEAMEHFRRMGTIIYLKLPYDQLKRRLGNLKGRGVVLKKGQTGYRGHTERNP